MEGHPLYMKIRELQYFCLDWAINETTKQRTAAHVDNARDFEDFSHNQPDPRPTTQEKTPPAE